MDPEEYREQSRRSWEDAAAGWGARADAMQAAAMPVSVWMIEAIDPQPGQTVVELAAGPGDTGFLAAELLRPGGGLLCTDGAPEMVEIARARATAAGLDDVVQCRVMEAEWIDLSAATVDAVLCRWGYMLLADPEAALRETRRILRPGGRVALAAWASPSQNPWNTLVGAALERHGAAPPAAATGDPGMYAFADEGRIEGLLQDAGFADIETDVVTFTFQAPDAQTWWEHLAATSPGVRGALQRLSPAEVYRLRDDLDEACAPYTAADGSLALPAVTRVAAASA